MLNVYVRLDFGGVSWGWMLESMDSSVVLCWLANKESVVLYYKTKLGGCVASGTNAWGSACEATSVRSGRVWTIRARLEISGSM